mgnify:CR=1 FL=1
MQEGYTYPKEDWGAHVPNKVGSCSDFVADSMKRMGYDVEARMKAVGLSSRVSQAQATYMRHSPDFTFLPASARAKPGDILFYDWDTRPGRKPVYSHHSAIVAAVDELGRPTLTVESYTNSTRAGFRVGTELLEFKDARSNKKYMMYTDEAVIGFARFKGPIQLKTKPVGTGKGPKAPVGAVIKPRPVKISAIVTPSHEHEHFNVDQYKPQPRAKTAAAVRMDPETAQLMARATYPDGEPYMNLIDPYWAPPEMVLIDPYAA